MAPPKKPPEKKAKPHTVGLSPQAVKWIEANLPRSLSTSRFAGAAVDHFIASGAAKQFISDENKKK